MPADAGKRRQRKKIDADVAEYRGRGGRIRKIPPGVSGARPGPLRGAAVKKK